MLMPILLVIYILFSRHLQAKEINEIELRSRLHTKIDFYLKYKEKNELTNELANYFYFVYLDENEEDIPLKDYVMNTDYGLFDSNQKVFKYVEKFKDEVEVRNLFDEKVELEVLH